MGQSKMKARTILCLFCAGRDRLETFVTGNIPQNSPFSATRMIIHDISGKNRFILILCGDG